METLAFSREACSGKRGLLDSLSGSGTGVSRLSKGRNDKGSHSTRSQRIRKSQTHTCRSVQLHGNNNTVAITTTTLVQVANGSESATT